MRNIQSADAATRLASRVCTALREPIHLDGLTPSAGCSIGIAVGPDHAQSVRDLLRCADIALYSAKATRDTAVVYDKPTLGTQRGLLQLENDLPGRLPDPKSVESRRD
jgi:GGDEF domain-containing protein